MATVNAARWAAEQATRRPAMHSVGDRGGVWYGGMGHKLIGIDSDYADGSKGVTCYRCGMAAEPEAYQELIPDCAGPDAGDGHHWQGVGVSNECAYGDAEVTREGSPRPTRGHIAGHCIRA